jgi:anhydro-N-acetylmuramic acid kinase
MTKIYRSLGLMSGTSMDGVDLAVIESDGKKIINRKNSAYQAYSKELKAHLKAIIYHTPTLQQIKLIENELTLFHADFVNDFIAKNKINRHEIDLVSFHGHTIFHSPKQQITWQLGNAHLLAEKIGIDVIADFRSRDVALNGQGAPLVPIYHFHLFADQKKPAAVLNIGGISNITYLPSDNENDIEAFDVCFGNAPSDDLMREKFDRDFDHNGELAKKGVTDFILADSILKNEIFHKKPPKSFDRDDFAKLLAPINSLKIEDALATFAYMHAKAIRINLDFLPNKPHEIFVCGGGRKNLALMDEMKKWLSGIAIKTAEEIGLNGDTIEAEAFAFLGIRSVLGLPLSFTKTTGISSQNNFNKSSSEQNFSSCGGVFYPK